MNAQSDSSRMAIQLTKRAVVEIAGEEAREFLHSLVTNDVRDMRHGEVLWAGLLTPQGKILFDFFIAYIGGERFLLDVSAAQKPQLLQRLAMYRLRRKVEIIPRPELAVAIGEGVDEVVVSYGDVRFAELGLRHFVTAEVARKLSGDTYAYHEKRISLGLPDSDADIGSGKLFPHEANFDQLNGVSFTKGCYVGQEVVSRMQHRGTTRNRLLPVIGEGPLETGMEIRGADKRIGELFSTASDRAIALVRLDRAAAALEAGAPLMAGDVPVRLVRPEWARFDVPGTEA